MERKGMFIKANMAGDVNTIRLWVVTPIAMMSGTVTKEHTRCRTEVHFVLIVWTEMRVALASKNPKERKIGFVLEHMFEG